MNKRLLFIALSTFTITACGSNSPQEPNPLHTGINGQVFVGPMMNICIENDPACFPPVEATFQLFRESVKVLTFRTDPDGKFQIAVAAGDYDLVGGDDAPNFVRDQTVHITVPDGPVITVRLEFLTPIV